jgi:hypothetical protein
MKFAIKFLSLLILTIQLINLSCCLKNSNEKLSNNKSLNNQVPISALTRTHHYEQAEEAAPGSIVGRVLPVPRNNPALVSSNNWTIPFPMERPNTNIIPINSGPGISQVNPIPMRQAVLNYPQTPFSAPPGSQLRIPMQPSMPMEMPIPMQAAPRPNILGGVPPTLVNIARPLPLVQRIGLNGFNAGSEFINSNSNFNNDNLNGMESIDDIKITSKYFI